MVKTTKRRKRKLFNMELTSRRKERFAQLEQVYGKVAKTKIIDYAMADALQFHKVAAEKEKELMKYKRKAGEI